MLDGIRIRQDADDDIGGLSKRPRTVSDNGTGSGKTLQFARCTVPDKDLMTHFQQPLDDGCAHESCTKKPDVHDVMYPLKL
jgi:hypothetical protein